MKNLFPGFYRPDADTLRALMRSATVILDSSALLNLYRYPTQAREDLLSVLDAISDRLWLPHQVALEFQQNRPAVIADQLARFREVRTVIDQAERNFVDELTRLQLDKRHSTIDPKRFVDRLRRALKDFRENLDTLEQTQPDVHHDDIIRKKIDSLYAGKIGSVPSVTGRSRYDHKIPPGYMDESKTQDSYVQHDGFVHKKFGDLILWNELLDEMKRANTKNVIFVTDDEKEDWWWFVKSEGVKTLGPSSRTYKRNHGKGKCRNILDV